uniref:NudC domain-containing protein 1 n=1 Tax=Meloidogyne javanica TaxID=6303 RepID=A0A915LQ59_MELJA
MVARAKSGSPPIKIMKKSEIQSSSNFVEETAFGENLQIGCFDDTFKKFFAYSGNDVISFNVDSGERIRLLSFTNSPQYFLWNVDTGDQIASINIQLPSDQLALWTYNFDGKYFILAQSIENKKKSQVKTTKSSVNENQGGSNSAVKLPKRREYHIDAKFDVVDQNLVEFKEVVISGDALYAVLNIGRVYCCRRREYYTADTGGQRSLVYLGLGFGEGWANIRYEPTICVSDIGTSFIGFGNAQLYKYNLTASSGVGRWISHEHLLLESPPRSLLLCGDFTKMAVLLRDNTLCFISTSQMQLISRAEVLHVLCLPEQYNNENYRFSITNDPALENELLFVSNARLGHIQWIDPLCWQTTCILDIAEENGPPPQDTFNMPKFQWLNTYLVCLSLQMLVSCESSRDNPEK